MSTATETKKITIQDIRQYFCIDMYNRLPFAYPEQNSKISQYVFDQELANNFAGHEEIDTYDRIDFCLQRVGGFSCGEVDAVIDEFFRMRNVARIILLKHNVRFHHEENGTEIKELMDTTELTDYEKEMIAAVELYDFWQPS